MCTKKHLVHTILFILFAATLSTASPIVSVVNTNDYGETLSLLDDGASFTAAARYAPSNFKIRIDGDPDGRVTGGNGITWNTGDPQPFTLSFDGSTVSFSVVDDGITYTVSAQPENPEVNTIIIMLRNQAVPARSPRTLAVSNLALNGSSLAIAGISLGWETNNVSMIIQNTGASFTLSGNLSILGTGPGGDERPIINFFGGMTTVPEPAGDETPTPEPGTFLLSMAGIALLYGGRKRLQRR